MRRLLKKGVGVILVILGFLALITPLTPGSWLIPIGLELLGLRFLLEDRLRSLAASRPGTPLAKVIHRVLRVKDRPPGVANEEARNERTARRPA
jgi:hypothetical protein